MKKIPQLLLAAALSFSVFVPSLLRGAEPATSVPTNGLTAEAAKMKTEQYLMVQQMSKQGEDLDKNADELNKQSLERHDQAKQLMLHFRQLTNKSNPENSYTGTTLNVLVQPNLVKAAYLGLFLTPAEATLQSQLKLTAGTGMVITNVDAKSPAETAGLQPHDIITLFGDQIVINSEQFQVLVRSHKAGDTVELTIIRQAQPQKISVTFAEKEQPDLAWNRSVFNSTPANGTGMLTLTGPSTSANHTQKNP